MLPPDMNNYAAVLFDMDGVIMDSMDWHTLAWQEVFRSLGKDITRDFILQNEGSGDVFMWARLLWQQEITPQSPAQDVARAVEYLRGLGRQQRGIFLAKYKQRVRPYPGALDILQNLQAKGKPTALVTSSSRITTDVIVPAPLRQCLGVVIAAEDVSQHKPLPAPYLAAAAQLGVEASQCLVVENSPGGISAGKAAGASCAGISSTLPASFLSQADQVFSSLENLRDYFNL